MADVLWAKRLTELARDLYDNRVEAMELRRGMLDAREQAASDPEVKAGWQFENSLLLRSRDLQEELLQLDTEREGIIQAILIVRLYIEQDVHYAPELDPPPLT